MSEILIGTLASAPGFITLEDLKTYLGISGSGEDDKLGLIVEGVNAAIDKFVKRKLLSQQHTEYVSGSGHNMLYLREYPVTSVETLHVAHGEYGTANAFTEDTFWEENIDYVIESKEENEHNQGLIHAIRKCFPCGHRNVKIVYTAGYTSPPEDLVLAGLQIAAQVRKDAQHGVAVLSERIGDYSYTLVRNGSCESILDARKMLGYYRRVSI